MKVYAVVVDFQDKRDSVIHGIYKQYRHAYQEEQRLLDIGKILLGTNQIKVRIIDQEVTE